MNLVSVIRLDTDGPSAVLAAPQGKILCRQGEILSVVNFQEQSLEKQIELDYFYRNQPVALWNGVYYEVRNDMVVKIDVGSGKVELCPLLKQFDGELQHASFWHAGSCILIQCERNIIKLDLRTLTLEEVIDVPISVADASMCLHRDGNLSIMWENSLMVYRSSTKSWDRKEKTNMIGNFKAFTLGSSRWLFCGGSDIGLYDAASGQVQTIYSHVGGDIGQCNICCAGSFLFILSRAGQLLILSHDDVVRSFAAARRFQAEIKKDVPVPRLKASAANTSHFQCAAKASLGTAGPAFISPISSRFLAVRQQKDLAIVDFPTQAVSKRIEMPEDYAGEPAAFYAENYFEIRKGSVLKVALGDVRELDRVQRVQIAELPGPTTHAQSLIYEGVILMVVGGQIVVFYLDTLEWRCANPAQAPQDISRSALFATGLEELSLCGSKGLISYNFKTQAFAERATGLDGTDCKLLALKDDNGVLMARESELILTDMTGSYTEVVYSAEASIGGCNLCFASQQFLCLVDARGTLLILEAPGLLARVRFEQILEIKLVSQRQEK